MWRKILRNVFTLGIPAIIDAVARNRRKKREQQARLKREAMREKCKDERR